MQNTKLVKVSLGIVAALVAMLIGALLARTLLSPQVPTLQSGTLVEPPRPTAPFSLVTADGAPFSNESLQRGWSLMFFGFTHCGDICPVTLTLLANVAKQVSDLPEDQKPQIVFVSVDAQRDTPDVMRAYLRSFNADIVGVTGTQDDLDAFTRSLGVPSAIRPLETGYAVDHSASILAFDRSGSFRALFSPPHGVDVLARDYRALVQQ